MKEGGIGAWDLTPVFKGKIRNFDLLSYSLNCNYCIYFTGIGFANLILVFLGNVYYEVILAWSLRYLFDSFSRELPWKFCSNKWNSPCCSEQLLYGESYLNLSRSDDLFST